VVVQISELAVFPCSNLQACLAGRAIMALSKRVVALQIVVVDALRLLLVLFARKARAGHHRVVVLDSELAAF